MDRLRAIGLDAEAAMLAETGGVNTHRGAIFGLGLLSAAAGLRHIVGRHTDTTLGEIVRRHWSDAIRHGPVPPHSHGATAGRRYGAAGARGEAAAGFPLRVPPRPTGVAGGCQSSRRATTKPSVSKRSMH